MDKKRSEEIKTMILICLIFFGVNYALYTFVLVPKNNTITQYKTSSEETLLNHSFHEMKEIEKEDLMTQIEESKYIDEKYNEMVAENLDTIAMTVELYDYIQLYEGKGLQVDYDLSDITEGIEAKNEQALQEEIDELSGLEAEEEDEMNSQGVIDIMETDKTSFRQGIISLTLELKTAALKDFLEDLYSISNQYTQINQLTIRVGVDDRLALAEKDGDAQAGLVKTSEETEKIEVTEEVNKVDSDNTLDISEGVEVASLTKTNTTNEELVISDAVTENLGESNETLNIEILMKAFVVDESVMTSNRDLYEFYEKYGNNNSYQELFKAQE